MSRDPRYDILFEPVRIGPVTAKNRFYQVPHCNGMGFKWPQSHAKMREVKAEGGWAVICTEECMIHATSDGTPYPQGRLWDDGDIELLALFVEGVHRHGALAGVELVHHGQAIPNLFTREYPIAPCDHVNKHNDPVQARAMDKADIRAFRGWHRKAALRARSADVDLVYVYAAHDLALPQHFLSRRRNQRTDEYGGSLENRARLLRELIEETKDAVGDRCGVVVRFAVDEMVGDDGITAGAEGREVIEMLGELPDMWDVNISDFSKDAPTPQFQTEGHQEPYIAFVKTLTTKPVVGVGWFTSPDTMASQVRRGVLDMIGCARPSIADPFLPRKIEEGRIDDIRECIACNVCVGWGVERGVPMRCTQNPSVGEEWRRGWHPERIAAKGSDDSVLVVGAGPAGLEAARALGQRGYAVTLSEAATELGGRVAHESRLPGLAPCARVRDYRVGQIRKMPNVEVFLDSRLTTAHVLELGCHHVMIATGATWRRDGVGRVNTSPIAGSDRDNVFAPEAVMRGEEIPDPVVVFDDDHYYLGCVLAERLRKEGRRVTLLTPAADVANWTHLIYQQTHMQTHLMELGVKIVPHRNLVRIGANRVTTACVFTGRRRTLAARAVVLVTARLPERALYDTLCEDAQALAGAGIKSVRRIGDCFCPGIIAAAVFDGHAAAQGLDSADPAEVPFRRERMVIEAPA